MFMVIKILREFVEPNFIAFSEVLAIKYYSESD